MKRILLALAAFLAVLPVCGCNRNSSTPRLRLFVVSEYVPQEVMDGFSKETGIPVAVEVFDTNEQMLTKLLSSPGQYDLIQPSEYIVEHLIARGLLAPLDLSHIPNVANLDPEFRNLAFDPSGKFSVPYMSGTVGIIVNTDKVKDPVRSYSDVFQEKYRNRILVVDDNREIVSWALAAKGLNINQITPQSLAAVKPLLTQWLSLGVKYEPANPQGKMLNGDADLGIIYSGDAAKLIAQDKKFQYALPSEGAHRFIDNLCIPKDAKNKDAAEKFINYVLRPEVSKMISDKFPYTNPNAAARKLLSSEQLSNPASYPPDAGKLEIFHDIGKASSDISELISQIKK